MPKTATRLKDSKLPDFAECIRLYRAMVLLRRFELAAQASYKASEIPGFIHLYIGEEAVAVGVCSNLFQTDWITSTHRGHGHALAKGCDPLSLMAELFGKSTGLCGGRGGSMHLYDPSAGLFGTNGFVAAGIPAAVGIAAAARSRGESRVSAAFFGDGAFNHGALHESINFATAQSAPVIFVCENNLYATATPLTMASRNTDLAARAAAYGLPSVAVDGNDVIAVRDAASVAVDRARSGDGPTFIEARTYRTVGHHEGDQLVGTYRTQEELDAWKARCPIDRYRSRILGNWPDREAELVRIDAEVSALIDQAVQFARTSPLPETQTALDFGWASFKTPSGQQAARPETQSGAVAQTRTLTWLDAVRDGIAEEMRRDPRIMYFGEGTGERGGSFGHTKGLWHEFGPARMVDTPISEIGFTGAAVGASATGSRSVADLMFADFVFEAASQIIQQAGKLHSMSNGKITAPILVRAGMGAIKNAGPHHSGSYHALWAHCPGLIVIVPSNPADAKGLMKSALRASDPVLFFEPKILFSSKAPVPDGEHLTPIGFANIVRFGTGATIAAAGSLVHRCIEAADRLAAEGISCEVIDLRTIAPLDVDTVAQSVIKTGRLLVVDEDFAAFGVGAELAAAMMELAFDYLDAPVGRLHTEPIAHPFSPTLEDRIVVTTDKIATAVRDLIRGAVPLPTRAIPYRELAKEGAAHLFIGAQPAGGAVTSQPKAAAPSAVSAASPANAESQCLEVGRGIIAMPNIGLTETEATVGAWRVAIGSTVAQGDVILEIQSEKALLEVEAPCSGILVETFLREGAVAQIGQALGRIEPKEA